MAGVPPIKEADSSNKTCEVKAQLRPQEVMWKTEKDSPELDFKLAELSAGFQHRDVDQRKVPVLSGLAAQQGHKLFKPAQGWCNCGMGVADAAWL